MSYMFYFRTDFVPKKRELYEWTTWIVYVQDIFNNFMLTKISPKMRKEKDSL